MRAVVSVKPHTLNDAMPMRMNPMRTQHWKNIQKVAQTTRGRISDGREEGSKRVRTVGTYSWIKNCKLRGIGVVDLAEEFIVRDVPYARRGMNGGPGFAGGG